MSGTLHGEPRSRKSARRAAPRRDPGPAADAGVQVRETTPDAPPAWLRSLDQACWASGPDRRIRFLNAKAEALLGLRAADWLGRTCDEVVGGRELDGRPLCGPACNPVCAALCGDPVAPVEMLVGPRGRRSRWARVTVIPIAAPNARRPWVVHIASDVGRERRAERYLERVARRSDPIRDVAPTRAARPLTARESEILDLLCEDEELGRVALRLGIARATVRNHVQRLLAAVGAHSVPEAVALRLLGHA